MTAPIFDCRFHHLGLAVKCPEKALVFLAMQRYRVPEPVFDPTQKAHLIWCTHSSMPAVEVIYQSCDDGPLKSVLSGRTESIYHLCYEVQDVPTALQQLKTSGQRVICVSTQKASALFQGQNVGFYYIGGFGLIELVAPARPAPTR